MSWYDGEAFSDVTTRDGLADNSVSAIHSAPDGSFLACGQADFQIVSGPIHWIWGPWRPQFVPVACLERVIFGRPLSLLMYPCYHLTFLNLPGYS